MLAFAFVVLAIFAMTAIADIGPGPPSEYFPVFIVNATYAGRPVPDDTDFVMHCDYANPALPTPPLGEESHYTIDNEGSCNNGVCRGSGWKNAPCGGNNAVVWFGFRHPSFGLIMTSAVPSEMQTTYHYNVALSSNYTSVLHFVKAERNEPQSLESWFWAITGFRSSSMPCCGVMVAGAALGFLLLLSFAYGKAKKKELPFPRLRLILLAIAILLVLAGAIALYIGILGFT